MKKLLNILTMLFIVLSLSSCTMLFKSHKDYNKDLPDIGAEAGITSESVDKNQYGVTDRWWETFANDELDLLVDEAFKGNFDIWKSYWRLKRDGAFLYESSTSLLPFLSIEGGRTRSGTEDKDGNLNASTDTYSGSALASYEVDIWGKNVSKIRASLFDKRASTENLKTLLMTISAEVSEKYFTLIEKKEQLKLAELTNQSYRNMVELMELRYAKGLVQTLNVYQAKVNLASSAAELPTLESDIKTLEADLNIMLGKDPRQSTNFVMETLPEAPVFPLQIPSDLLMKRPDVREAFYRVKSADERAAIAFANRLPSVNLLGVYGGQSTTLETVLDFQNIAWSTAISATMPVFEWGKRSAAVRAKKAQFMESLENYRKTVFVAIGDVYKAIIKNKTSEEKVTLLEDVVYFSENTLRVAKSQYLEGLSDYLNVLNAQQTLFNSKKSLITEKRKLLSNRIELARSLGGSWMTDETKIIEKRGHKKYKSKYKNKYKNSDKANKKVSKNEK